MATGGVMVIRRAVLVALLLSVPPLLTWVMYRASMFLLAATDRVIDPRLLWYAGVAELLAFFFIAFLEVKDRW